MSTISSTWKLSRSGMAAEMSLALAAFRTFGVRGWLVAALGAAAAALLIGLPTALIENPVFGRMIEARTQDYVLWVFAAALAGLIAGTFALSASTAGQGGTMGGGVLSYLAVGCPTCNKLVVLLLGSSGALTFFAPLQVFLGIASLGLLAWVLRLRLRATTGVCDAAPAADRSAA